MEQPTTTQVQELPLDELLELPRADLFPEDNGEPANTMDVSRQIYAIRKLDDQIEFYTLQEREARLFYEQRRDRCQERIDMLKHSILAFLEQNNLRNVQTPCGTAFKRKVTVRSWPSDDQLLAWAEANLPTAIRIKRESDRRMILEHMCNTGAVPEGYSEKPETRLGLR